MRIDIDTGRGQESISAELTDGADCRALLVFAHGAGAGMHHEFMSHTAAALADAGIATLRFQFPYMERERRPPDRQSVLLATIANVTAHAERIADGRPLFAGGKSMGGRMASIAAADGLLDNVVGLVFFGFPLHAAGTPSQQRAVHLTDVVQPMLFLQGTRDRLADAAIIKSVCDVLADRATLRFFEGADHSFKFLKSDAAKAASIYDDIAATVHDWIDRCMAKKRL